MPTLFYCTMQYIGPIPTDHDHGCMKYVHSLRSFRCTRIICLTFIHYICTDRISFFVCWKLSQSHRCHLKLKNNNTFLMQKESDWETKSLGCCCSSNWSKPSSYCKWFLSYLRIVSHSKNLILLHYHININININIILCILDNRPKKHGAKWVHVKLWVWVIYT